MPGRFRYAVCRCGAFECGVAAVVIVGVEEVGEGRDAGPYPRILDTGVITQQVAA